MVGTRVPEKGMSEPAHKTPKKLKTTYRIGKTKANKLKLLDLKTDTPLGEENVAA